MRSARGGAIERDDASGRHRLTVRDRRTRRRRLELGLDSPTRPALTAMEAAQEHRALLAPHPVVVPAGQIAVNQVPHNNSLVRRSDWLLPPMAREVPRYFG